MIPNNHTQLETQARNHCFERIAPAVADRVADHLLDVVGAAKRAGPVHNVGR